MTHEDEARRDARASETSQSDVAQEKEVGATEHFSMEPLNLGGLQAPFTWDNLARQVQEMDDLERYGHRGCEYLGVCK